VALHQRCGDERACAAEPSFAVDGKSSVAAATTAATTTTTAVAIAERDLAAALISTHERLNGCHWRHGTVRKVYLVHTDVLPREA
jgi:hypothetical protein